MTGRVLDPSGLGVVLGGGGGLADEPAGGLVPGDLLPVGAPSCLYRVERSLPARWGLLRYRAVAVDGGGLAEVLLPGNRPLPEALDLLVGGRRPHLPQVLGRASCRGVEVAVLEQPAGEPVQAGLSHDEGLRALGAAGQALDGLHQLGLCHLDVRPEHLLRLSDGSGAVLVGLGQVRREGLLGLAAGTPLTQRTGEHGPLELGGQGTTPGGGTPDPFTAPEQRAQGVVDRRADVYSLAAVARHVLVPRPREEIGGEAEPVGEVLWRALSEKPQRRPSTCGEFLDDLRAALSASVAPPPPPCVLVVAGSTAKRRELQGLVTAVAPRIPVLADGGAHGATLARRYRPRLLLLDLPSLPPGAAVSLCRALVGDPLLSRTQVIALQPTDVEVQSLTRLGALVMPAGAGRGAAGADGRWPAEPLVQLLRQHLHVGRRRG